MKFFFGALLVLVLTAVLSLFRYSSQTVEFNAKTGEVAVFFKWVFFDKHKVRTITHNISSHTSTVGGEWIVVSSVQPGVSWLPFKKRVTFGQGRGRIEYELGELDARIGLKEVGDSEIDQLIFDIINKREGSCKAATSPPPAAPK